MSNIINFDYGNKVEIKLQERLKMFNDIDKLIIENNTETSYKENNIDKINCSQKQYIKLENEKINLPFNKCKSKEKDKDKDKDKTINNEKTNMIYKANSTNSKINIKNNSENINFKRKNLNTDNKNDSKSNNSKSKSKSNKSFGFSIDKKLMTEDKLSDFESENKYDLPKQINSNSNTNSNRNNKCNSNNDKILIKKPNKKISNNSKLDLTEFINANHPSNRFEKFEDNPFEKNKYSELNKNKIKNKNKDKDKNKNTNSKINKLNKSPQEVNKENQKDIEVKVKEIYNDYDFHNFPLLKNIDNSNIDKKKENIFNNNKNNFIYNKEEFHNNENFIINNCNKKILLNRKLINLNNVNYNHTNFKINQNQINFHKKNHSTDYLNIPITNNNNYNNNNYKRTKDTKNNFGERLYNYKNLYENKRLIKFQEEIKMIQNSSIPKITKKAKNIKRDGNNFQDRLYPFVKTIENNINNNRDNSKLSKELFADYEENKSSDDIYYNNQINSNPNNYNYHNKNGYKYTNVNGNAFDIKYNYDNNIINNNNEYEDSEEYAVNLIYKKNFDFSMLNLYNEKDNSYSFLNTYTNKGNYSNVDNINSRSDKSYDNLNFNSNEYKKKVNFYNKKIYDKSKDIENKYFSSNFTPKLNKRSLNIAKNLPPSSERLTMKKKSKSKSSKNLYNHNTNYTSNTNNPQTNTNPNMNINFIKNNNYDNNYSFEHCYDSDNNNKSNKKKSKSTRDLKRLDKLYQKGLENIKKRVKVSTLKKQLEENSYRQFSYKPIINNYKQNCYSNFTIDKDKEKEIERKIKDNTFTLENNEQLINFDLNKEKDNQNHFYNHNKQNPIKEESEKYKEIYEKNLIWKELVENKYKKIKNHQEEILINELTFKPNINKNEIKSDEKFIERNLDQIQDYVNRRRANIKKKEEEEEFKRKKFSLGKDFKIKPTIPKEFNLSKPKVNYNKNNENNPFNNNKYGKKLQEKTNINFIISDNNINRGSKAYFSNNDNKNNKSKRQNKIGINEMRSELRIDNFFDECESIDILQNNNNSNNYNYNNINNYNYNNPNFSNDYYSEYNPHTKYNESYDLNLINYSNDKFNNNNLINNYYNFSENNNFSNNNIKHKGAYSYLNNPNYSNNYNKHRFSEEYEYNIENYNNLSYDNKNHRQIDLEYQDQRNFQYNINKNTNQIKNNENNHNNNIYHNNINDYNNVNNNQIEQNLKNHFINQNINNNSDNNINTYSPISHRENKDNYYNQNMNEFKINNLNNHNNKSSNRYENMNNNNNKNNNNQNYKKNPQGQIEFIDAIKNLHEKLSNLDV
jgi:hypothetical protein